MATSASSVDQGGKPRRRRMVIVTVFAVWIYLYNLLIKEQGPGQAFFEILDTISQTWSTGPPLAPPRCGHSCVVVGSLLYVIGGYDDER